MQSGYVAIVGRPNVGKSTLLNQLVGQRLAITSHKSQTTRHRILGIKTTDDYQIIYLDTPGIHKPGISAMSRYLNRAAHTSMHHVDVILFLVQALVWTEEDEAVLKMIASSNQAVIAVLNKLDRIDQKDRLLPYLDKLSRKAEFSALIPVSALTGSHCDDLEHEILRHLPSGERLFPEDQVTDRPERFFAAEIIREQLIKRYHDEIPYALTVEIETFEETESLYKIGAIVWVEKENQRGILVGKNGNAMKIAAAAARKEMEGYFMTKVYLTIWVKVKNSWSSDEAALNQLGYVE